MDDIFNLNPDDYKAPEKKSAVSQFYSPDPKDAKDQVYKAVLRFVPNLDNRKESIIRKVVHWLQEGDRQGFYADCPSSVGEKSMASDVYWKLKGSQSAYEQKQSEKIGRKEYFFSYVYVVKDFQKPELNGTIQVLRYPKTIRTLIDKALQPDAMAIEEGIEPTNVFDLFNGKDFILQVGLKSNFKNYDGCKFSARRTPIAINGVPMQADEESRKAIIALYSYRPEGMAPLPPLNTFAYKPWTDELRDRVMAFLNGLTNGGVSAPMARVTAAEPRQAVPVAERLESVSAPAASPQPDPVAAHPVAAHPVAAEAAAGTGSSELDEWLRGM